MIVISENLVLSPTGSPGPDHPVIGWHNLVTATNISADTAEADYPVTNLANPSTFLQWRGRGLDAFTKLLLHCDGADASTTFTDLSLDPHAVTPNGNAQVDTAQSKFGGASLLLDGTGDFLTVNGGADFAFGLGDFTIDLQFRLNAVGAERRLYDSRPSGTASGAYVTLSVTSGNVLQLIVNGAARITGATTLATGAWHHVALARFEGVTKLFLDGVQQGSSYVDATSYLNGTNRPVIGADGNNTANNNYNGWLDEIRVSKGIARWTEAFTAPTLVYFNGDQHLTAAIDDTIDYIAFARHNLGSGQIPVSVEGFISGSWQELVGETLLANDDPVLFRFVPTAMSSVRLRMQDGNASPRAAVMYAGRLTVCERKIYRGHTPINYGRTARVVNNRSESGEFLGRIVLSEARTGVISLNNLTPAWYRENLDPFIAASKAQPFFFAWRPGSYPFETGFEWMTNDPRPVPESPNNLIGIEMQVGGLGRSAA